MPNKLMGVYEQCPNCRNGWLMEGDHPNPMKKKMHCCKHDGSMLGMAFFDHTAGCGYTEDRPRFKKCPSCNKGYLRRYAPKGKPDVVSCSKHTGSIQTEIGKRPQFDRLQGCGFTKPWKEARKEKLI
jgi:uncharacterized protein (DUF983 family)